MKEQPLADRPCAAPRVSECQGGCNLRALGLEQPRVLTDSLQGTMVGNGSRTFACSCWGGMDSCFQASETPPPALI